MFVYYIVADESKSLIILYEVGISEVQLSDKNREVPGGQAARLWWHPAGGEQPELKRAQGLTPTSQLPPQIMWALRVSKWNP